MSFDAVITSSGRTRHLGRPRPETRTAHPEGPLIGAVVVFTGSRSLSRHDAADLAAQHGMEVGSTVTNATPHLVVGDQYLSVLAGHRTSSKHRKAERMHAAGHPIRVFGATEFLDLVSSDH
ncbi:BRCT domain-containing protein [Yoonia sp.]|uniref:BRCT domain-containing protein n=1 Tax=Yoonia sp. TaxID=2212373 RepID=UPI003A4E3A85